MRYVTKNTSVKNAVFILFSCMIMAFNTSSIIQVCDLSPGGASGLSLLIQGIGRRLFHLNIQYTPINIVVNLIPVYIGFRYIGRKFTISSCIVVLLTSVLIDIFPAFTITNDILLCAIFGGVLQGFAASICLIAGTTTGGTDFISIYLSEKKNIDAWNLIMGFNVIVLVLSGMLYGWDKAMYSIVFQFTMTQVLHIMYKRYQQQTLLIVTDEPKGIYNRILQLTNHSATFLKGEGGFQRESKTLIYSVISRDESKLIINEIKKIDPNAFVNLIRTESIAGQFYLKPNE